ncbi:NUDIX domain-containing protein, partial [Saccharothrix sp. ST-888]|uniref:NUDIX domain-containing protein n=1 Tax=Saccharothrix sp. ST-888 TaxID=1427391 RepID=UPI000B0DFB43
TYRAGWQLLGGAAHAGASIGTAAARELAEETGLTREITHAFAVDQMPRNTETGSTAGLHVVCDPGRLTADEPAVVAVPDSATGELTGPPWVPLDPLGETTLPYQ